MATFGSGDTTATKVDGRLMEKPSYYAVIPAPVRYSAISPNAKLLFGEITCLCEAEGYCWASNGYLAKLYDAGERTVSRWLTELEKAQFIRIEPAVNQHGQRRIFIASALPKVASQKWQAKNGEHNNTRVENTTSKETPPVSPKPTKASSRANPVRSIAVLLEDTTEILDYLLDDARNKHGLSDDTARDEWAKFRNHHISARSKHTRIDLCWDTWCRNAAKWGKRGTGNAGGGAGQGGFKRHDHVAAARDSVLAELFGVGPEGHGRPPAAADTEPNPFGDEPEATDAVYVDVTASPETSVQRTAGAGGGGADRFDGSPLPLEVQSG